MANEQWTLIDVVEKMSARQDVGLKPMRVAQDIMTADVKTLILDHTVKQCLQFMESHRVRHAPVVDPPYGNQEKACFIGVVSRRDVLRLNAPDAENTDKEDTDIRALRQLLTQIVARKPKSASPQTPVQDVISTMILHHIDMVPVLDHGDVVGILTTTNLLKLLLGLDKIVGQLFPEPEHGVFPAGTDSKTSTEAEIVFSWISQTVQEIMSKELICLGPQDTLARAIEVTQNAEIRHLLVTDEQGKLVGLVSDRDILRNLPYVARRPPSPPKRFREHLFATRPSAKCLELPLERIMRQKVLHVMSGCGIFEAADTLFRKRIGCLPVLDDQENLRGIVSVTDLMRALLAVYEPMDKSTSSQAELAVMKSQAIASA